jgi:outer membrane lipoprotein SlyB
MDEEPQTPVQSSGETHATTAGAAAAGAVVAGAIGLTSGPLGAAIGAIGGALVGAAAERMMHSEDDRVPLTVHRSDTVDEAEPGTHAASESSGRRDSRGQDSENSTSE